MHAMARCCPRGGVISALISVKREEEKDRKRNHPMEETSAGPTGIRFILSDQFSAI